MFFTPGDTLAEEEEENDIDETVEVKMTVDELVKGALESSFWAMDRLILKVILMQLFYFKNTFMFDLHMLNGFRISNLRSMHV